MGDVEKGAKVCIFECTYYLNKFTKLSINVISRYSKLNALNATRLKRAANTKLDPTCTVYSDAKPVKLLVIHIPMPINKRVNMFLFYTQLFYITVIIICQKFVLVFCWLRNHLSFKLIIFNSVFFNLSYSNIKK